jgi:hypothetical protein
LSNTIFCGIFIFMAEHLLESSLPDNIDNCARFCPLACAKFISDGRRKAIRKAIQEKCAGPIVTESITYDKTALEESKTERTIFHACGSEPPATEPNSLLSAAHAIAGDERADNMEGIFRVIPQEELRAHNNWDAHYLMRYGIQ